MIGRLGGPAGLVDRPREVFEQRERLEHEQVDPALEQPVELLADGRPNGRLAQPQQLAGRRAERPDGSADPGVAPDHVAGLAGELRAAPVECARPVGQAVRGQPDPVGAEGRGLDQLGAGLEVLAVDRPDDLRTGRDQLVEVGPLRDPAGIEQRAHRAVGQQRPGRESGQEAGTLAGRRAPRAVIGSRPVRPAPFAADAERSDPWPAGVRRDQSGTTSRAAAPTTLRTTEPMTAATIVSTVMSGGKSPTVRSNPVELAT